MKEITQGNLFTHADAASGSELSDTLLDTGALSLRRIVSFNHSSAPGYWYDQDADEWVVLLSGSAAVLFEGESKPRTLEPGDYLLIPAHRRHRIEASDARQPSVWLALHFDPGA